MICVQPPPPPPPPMMEELRNRFHRLSWRSITSDRMCGIAWAWNRSEEQEQEEEEAAPVVLVFLIPRPLLVL